MAQRNVRRIKASRAAIHNAQSHFNPADKEQVQRLYSAYIATISNAFCSSRCHAAGCAQYDFNDDVSEGAGRGWWGSREKGYGRAKYPTGDCYEGGWLNGMHEGRGVYTWAEGDVYEGEWHKGMKHGLGQCFYADKADETGDTVVTVYDENRRVGEGVLWVQGRVPHKMVNGEISKEELAGGSCLWAGVSFEQVRILAALGLPADHTPQKRGPLAGRLGLGWRQS